MSNQNYKSRLDAYTSQERVFTERDKHNIYTRINNINNKPNPTNKERKSKFLFAKLAGPIVLVGLLIGITSLIPYNISQDNQMQQSGEEFEIPSTTTIKTKVNEINSDFQLGMTQQQVKDTFGENFIQGEAQNPEGESIPYWTYNYFKDPSLESEIAPIPGDINIQGLGHKKIGIQFSVFWKDKKVLFGTIAYRGSKNIKVIEFKRDGDVSKFTIDSW